MSTAHRSRAALLVATLLAPALLSGCSDDGGGGDERNAIKGPTAQALPVSGSTLLVSGPFDGEGGERISGTPTFVSGCLGAENDKESFLVVWPDGTAITSPTDDTIIVDGKQIPSGSTFVAHGSFVHAPFPEQLPQIPISCQSGDLTPVAWIQTIDSVEE